MNSVANIRDPADLIDKYCRPDSGHPWPLYDIDPSPNVLSGSDLTAPALLSYPVPGSHLNAMSRVGSPESDLVVAMRSFLSVPDGPSFWKLPKADMDWLCERERGSDLPDTQFGALVHALDLAQDVSGLTSVFVTKVLHRKRPNHVPLKDSRLCNFYGVADGNYAELFRCIHVDINRNHNLLRDLGHRAQRHAAHPMSPLRSLDIAVWMDEERKGPARREG